MSRRFFLRFAHKILILYFKIPPIQIHFFTVGERSQEKKTVNRKSPTVNSKSGRGRQYALTGTFRQPFFPAGSRNASASFPFIVRSRMNFFAKDLKLGRKIVDPMHTYD